MEESPQDPVSPLDELVDEATDVEVAAVRNGFEFRRAGTAFAARTPDSGAVELRLGEEIAEAATRTPDTTVSVRGAGWVRFAPRNWDEHALDRLEAWFRVAWRAAGDDR